MTTTRIGLRFDRRDAALLRGLAERARNKELGTQAVMTFESAAQAAETGEPLIVICEQPNEALLMAAGYTQFGVSQPAIEELTGDRPAR